ncbi:hypothetical protein NQ317_011435 [Molorchus minor]|uniref:Myosin tail domain-containing protein n=1 Tax=Molorchus minor TaxID=1323400 RepID=A0ABQ9J077_9CUCU|nr:hypothetical protein NQ317_011435 [Molorchus minor]
MSGAGSTKWQPTTTKYNYNYGVGINFYQPMVDFIEAKDQGRKTNFPHLPWTNELGLDQYDPLKIKSYSHEDLSRISRKTEASIKAKLRDFKSTASSSFVLSKSVSAASITQKTKMYDGLEDYRTKTDREIEEELRASQKYLRGKSAKAIERQLLSESKKDYCEEYRKRPRPPALKSNSSMPVSSKPKPGSRLRSLASRKKLQIQITELEMSLDSANKVNIDLQKTIKKQSLQLTEIQAHYDELQRQLQVTLDQLSVSQRRVQALTAEVEEIRGNYESALRGKRQAEQLYEEAGTRINELTTINVNLSSAKSKIEQELSCVVADYDEITKELRISDERYQRVQVELKHTVEILHEEQERVVKIEAIKKSLEIEVKNLSVRLEEVEANAIVGGKRIISKLEARLRDYEAELDEEKRRHAETIKILRKKERTVKEVMIQCEEDQKNIALDSYKKLLQYGYIKYEGVSSQSVTRVRRFQRELEAAEDRAETAESNLSLIRAKHRTFVTTSSVPGSQVYLVQESRTAEI